MDSANHISTIEQLAQLYGAVGEASIKKEVTYLHAHYQAIIQSSPFAVLATSGPTGLDVSPRGDAPGFVRIADEKTLMLPDRRGNNRIDSLRNIIAYPEVALLFFVPGLGETLRVNGTAKISVEPQLLQSFAVNERVPATVLLITVESVFFQCSRAIKRSGLWSGITQDLSQLPSPGKMLSALTDCEIDGEKYDSELPGRIEKTLY